VNAVLTASLTLAVTVAAFAAIWLASLRTRDAGIVDLYWGPGFAVVALLTLALERAVAPGQLLLVAMVTLWAARLGWHMASRHAKAGREDPRYARMRAERGETFARWSLPNVFLLQAVILWLVATPIHAGLIAGGAPLPGPWFWLAAGAGAALFAGGLALETAADLALSRFRADPANRGKLLTTGLFARVRHPNHLGEIILWLGIGLVALAISGRWQALLGPLLLWALVARLSGPPMLEPVLAARDGYRAWAAKTPALWPFRRPGGG
jgi:steroid 5-alpha reductase family enzyme